MFETQENVYIKIFGNYLTTFVSKNGQVRADIFQKEDKAIVYVKFAPGIDGISTTDSYYNELNDWAKENKLKWKLIYVDTIEQFGFRGGFNK